MPTTIPPPNVQELLAPVIACLPTAFVSPLPPPALLPYLSPILRQRVSLLSSPTQSTADQSRHDSQDSKWLHLLTWSPARARGLNQTVGNLQLEPHPVSGEIELFEDDIDGTENKVKYRRLDAETLQVKCDIPQHGLSVVWVWCTNDTGGVGLENATSQQAQDGWRVAEVLPCPSEDATEEENRNPALRWHSSAREAEDDAESRTQDQQINGTTENKEEQESDDNDDDYWAAYDRTPATRTPAKQSPPPGMTSQSSAEEREKQYYARYGTEVQPAMDAHDPEEAKGTEDIEYTLAGQNGDLGRRQTNQDMNREVPPPLGLESDGGNNNHKTNHIPVTERVDMSGSVSSSTQNPQGAVFPADQTKQPSSSDVIPIHSPVASRPSSPGRHSPVDVLEASASSSSAAEVGVKQHISTELKSLYRLAKSAGIDREEFERVIRTELDVLGMLD